MALQMFLFPREWWLFVRPNFGAQEVRLKSRCELDGLDRSFNATKPVSSQKISELSTMPQV